MTPDKLPEEITEDILLSAKAFAAGMWSGISKHDANQRIYVASVWEAGATAWAPWKVRYDEIYSELHESKQQSDNLRTAYDELGRKQQVLKDESQRMVEALEEIKLILKRSPGDASYGTLSMQLQKATELVNKKLSEWKDGKGKESVVGKCTKCGRHYPHANESGICNKCGKEEVGE